MAAYVKAPFLENWHLDSLHGAGFTVAEQLQLIAYVPFSQDFGRHAAAFRNNGGSTDQLLRWLVQRSVPVAWSYAAYPTRFLELPGDARLKAGQTYSFSLEMEGVANVAVINAGQFHVLARDGKRFSGEVRVQPGAVRLEALIKNEGVEGYWPLLVWQ
jgi:hypothetical protein